MLITSSSQSSDSTTGQAFAVQLECVETLWSEHCQLVFGEVQVFEAHLLHKSNHHTALHWREWNAP